MINDDIIAGGMGFSKHLHHDMDMEIISIPIEGDLRHGDSMGTMASLAREKYK